MNRARIASALRMLADAIEEDDPQAMEPAKKRRLREIPAPSGPVDDLARKRVEKTLREKGWTNG